MLQPCPGRVFEGTTPFKQDVQHMAHGQSDLFILFLFFKLHSLKLSPWKIVVGKLLCFWDGIFLRGYLSLSEGKCVGRGYEEVICVQYLLFLDLLAVVVSSGTVWSLRIATATVLAPLAAPLAAGCCDCCWDCTGEGGICGATGCGWVCIDCGCCNRLACWDPEGTENSGNLGSGPTHNIHRLDGLTAWHFCSLEAGQALQVALPPTQTWA